MLVQTSPRPVSWFSLLSLIAGGVVIVIACYALLAWIIDIDFLRNAIPGWPKMMPVTALCFILCGSSLCFQGTASVDSQTHEMDWERIFLSLVSPRLLARGSAFIVILIALLGLAYHNNYIWGLSQGGERPFFPDTLTSKISGFASQMPPNPSLIFLLVGCALLLLHIGTHRGVRAMQSLSLAALLAVLVAALNYVFGTQIFSGLELWPKMDPHEAFSFVFLSVGIVFARPEYGLMGILTNESLGAYTSRRMLIAVVVIPAVIGCLYLLGWRVGFYDARKWIPLIIVLNVLILFIVIWVNAVSLHKRESRRLKDVAVLREVNSRLERQVQEQTAEVMRANHDIWLEIQERVRLEEELRALTEELENEREQVLLKEEEVEQSVEDATRLRDEFLASVSAEMRAPLNAMLSWVKLLRNHSLTPEESARVLDAMEISTTELLAVASSLGGDAYSRDNDLVQPALASLPAGELSVQNNRPEIVMKI
jgi:signal transduction histidine kinase